MNPVVLTALLIGIALISIVLVGEIIPRHELPSPRDIERRKFREQDK